MSHVNLAFLALHSNEMAHFALRPATYFPNPGSRTDEKISIGWMIDRLTRTFGACYLHNLERLQPTLKPGRGVGIDENADGLFLHRVWVGVRNI